MQAGTPLPDSCERVCRDLVGQLLADIALIVVMDEDKGELKVLCGYDSSQAEAIAPHPIHLAEVPRIKAALERGEPIRAAKMEGQPDASFLAEHLDARGIGNILLLPLNEFTSQRPAAALLIRNDYAWEAEEIGLARNILLDQDIEFEPTGQAGPSDEYLHNQTLQAVMEELEEAESEREHYKRLAEEIEVQNEQYRRDVEKLLRHVSELEDGRPKQGSGFALVAQLRKENTELRRNIALLKHQEEEGLEPQVLEAIQAKEELRLALQEVAALHARIESSGTGKEGAASDGRIPTKKAEVIATLAQELRQPLSSVLGYSDLLLSESVGILGALQRSFLERVRNSSQRIDGLIENLIHIAELDRTGLELSPTAVDLSAVIDEAIKRVQESLRNKRVMLRVDLPRRLPRLQTDRDALQQIVLQLMQNAEAATPEEGEITLRIALESPEGQDEFMLIQVTDSGGGIREEDFPRVFSRVYRTENPLIEGLGDTGVGMTIAETLTQALGGRIWVESKEGVGATFTVLLPILPLG